ncbi:MAG: methionyl-tRNA formyltransferase [bacterium]
MNILFFATSDFAILPLKKLSKTNHKITLITKPDKPKGRGLKILSNPLKSIAEELKINVFQTDDIFSIVSQISPELIVVVAYGKILPKEIISRYKAINLHPSLLPKYRGASPIAWALINEEKKTGITIFWLDETMDGGDIILQKETDILPNDDYESLAGRLSDMGGEMLVDAISLIEEGKAERIKQSGISTFASKIKEVIELDFKEENRKIFNLIRGVSKDPGVWTMLYNEKIKVLKARLSEIEGDAGKILGKEDKGIIIGCGKGSIILDLLQKEGKKPISGQEFLCGIKGKTSHLLRRHPFKRGE